MRCMQPRRGRGRHSARRQRGASSRHRGAQALALRKRGPKARYRHRAQAIQTPARQIAINAGGDGSVVVAKIMEKDQYSYGYDAQAGEYGYSSPRASSIRLRSWAAPAGRGVSRRPADHHRSEGSRKAEGKGAPAMPGGGMGGMDY